MANFGKADQPDTISGTINAATVYAGSTFPVSQTGTWTGTFVAGATLPTSLATPVPVSQTGSWTATVNAGSTFPVSQTGSWTATIVAGATLPTSQTGSWTATVTAAATFPVQQTGSWTASVSPSATFPVKGVDAEGAVPTVNPIVAAGHNLSTGVVQVPDIFTAFGIQTTTVIQIGANAGLYNIDTTTGGGYTAGDVAHDAVDTGTRPNKIGGYAVDYEPDSTGEQGRAEVAAADRVDGAFNRRGQFVEGVNPARNEITGINATYNSTLSSTTSDAIECWNYRQLCIGFALEKQNTPTDFTIEVEVTHNNTDYYKLMNGGLGAWIYDDTAVGAAGIKRAYTFPICAYKFRVKTTAAGVDSTDKFIMTTANFYLRN